MLITFECQVWAEAVWKLPGVVDFRWSAGPGMTGFIEGVHRGQAALLPVRLEDWTGEDSLRVVDLFVDELSAPTG